MAEEHVECSMLNVCIFSDTKCLFMLDIDNNWVSQLLTLCTLLILYVDLVGGVGTCEANP